MEFNNLSINGMRSGVPGWVRETIRTMSEISAKYISQMRHLLSKDYRILFVNVVD